MRASLTSGSVFQGLAIIGGGAAMMWPEQRWVGGLIILVGIAALVFDVRVERGHVGVGSPDSLVTRLKSMWLQLLVVGGLVTFSVLITIHLQNDIAERAAVTAKKKADEIRRAVAENFAKHPESIRAPDKNMRAEKPPAKRHLAPVKPEAELSAITPAAPRPAAVSSVLAAPPPVSVTPRPQTP